jgi:hypothetical protein
MSQFGARAQAQAFRAIGNQQRTLASRTPVGPSAGMHSARAAAAFGQAAAADSRATAAAGRERMARMQRDQRAQMDRMRSQQRFPQAPASAGPRRLRRLFTGG